MTKLFYIFVNLSLMSGLIKENWVLMSVSAQSVAYIVLAGKDNQPNWVT